LRRHATSPERLLWAKLRDLKSFGFHFRRQVPIGVYFTDFACHHPKLVIELDGDTHAGKSAVVHDRKRDAFLREVGYFVLRFPNSEIVRNLDGVCISIFERLASLATPTRPAPRATLPSRGREKGARS